GELAFLGAPELVRLLSDASRAMCEGEIGQIERRFHFDLSEEEYLSFLDKKTASLMAASCRAGGAAAGLSRKQQEALETFGRRLGVAFQIVDDILDLEGDEAVTGKTLRTDLQHGKMTLPLIRYRDRLGSRSERKKFCESLRDGAGGFSGLIGKIRDAGAIAESRAKARLFVDEALRALDELPGHPARQILSDVAHRLTLRRF
ncbi:MAG TPA: polyprenyl synthetase family protein, partial [Elusimicrobiota bacterium]|nr:polyprenyl synthetase family protein [Elusimicrobiota bacterium]